MTYEIYQVIECLWNLLEYDGSQDAHLSSQNGKMEAILFNQTGSCNGYSIWVTIQGGCRVTGNFTVLIHCVNSLYDMVAGIMGF